MTGHRLGHTGKPRPDRESLISERDEEKQHRLTVSLPPEKDSGIEVPPGATVNIHITAPLNITPFVARQKVNSFVLSEISTQLLAEAPELRADQRLCWSVPVVLTSPVKGVIGQVGTILVDAATGEILVDEELVRRMTDDARRLAERSPL
jgi:hypothetical protein